MSTPAVQKFKLGDWKLQSGQTIPDAELAYKVHGHPSLPAIIYPSWFSGGASPPTSAQLL